MDVRGFLRDRKVWAAAGVGGALGLLVYARRRRQQGAGAGVATGQPITPAAADSSAVDAYNNLQGELENLQGQITALYGGAPLPTAQQAVAPAGGSRYVMTGKFGGAAGHPVDYDYLARIGYLTKRGSSYYTTGKLGAAGHPVSYSYLSGIGFLRAA